MNSLQQEDIRSISFHGADGCGKSTIASRVSDFLRTEGMEVLEIGGSSFRNWLTPAVASEFGCDQRLLAATCLTAPEKTALYEDIAVACYGLMDKVRKEGSHVVIDSDPVLKRMMWATIESDDDSQYEEYMTSFMGILDDRIGTVRASDYVHILPNDPANDVNIAIEVHDRMATRGRVSEYDPETLEQTEQIVAASINVWRAILDTERFRRSGSREHAFYNPPCESDQLEIHTNNIAQNIVQSILPFNALSH